MKSAGCHSMQAAVSAAAVALSLGCYKYVPATLETVPIGSGVRAMLSTPAQEELRNRTGINVFLLEGELLENTAERVLISVKAGEGSRMLGSRDLYQRIDVPRQGVVRIDVRKVDAARTGGLVAVLAGSAVVLASQAFKGNEPDRPEPPNGGPDDGIFGWVLRVSIFRF